VELDARNEQMKAKIRELALQKIPFVLIMGDKESEASAVSVRTRGKGDEGSVTLVDFIARCKALLQDKSATL
jgi:threonyl-tRNA synthetase